MPEASSHVTLQLGPAVGHQQCRNCFGPVSCSTLCLGPASGLLRRRAPAKPLLQTGRTRRKRMYLKRTYLKRTYLNRITLIGFLGGDAEKKVNNATNIAVFSL